MWWAHGKDQKNSSVTSTEKYLIEGKSRDTEALW